MMENESAIVLIVDDNQVNRDVLARRIQRRGYQVMMAANGREALKVMGDQDFDLVLLDIMMPEMNGYQVLERMKADDKLRYIPVIVVSALDEMESVVRCIELGAEDYLTKPFNRVLLQARIGASLEKKRLRDQERNYTGELEVLQHIDRELNTSLDVELATKITLEWAVRQSSSLAGLVVMLQEQNMQVAAALGYADQSLALKAELPIIQRAIQSAEPQCVNNLEPGAALLPTATAQVAIPIRRESKVIGVLLLEGLGYPDAALSFLDRFSDHAAIAIVNAQLYETVQLADQAKSEFVSFVAHELKNPMASIRGYTDLLQKGLVGAINKAQSKFLDTILTNVIRMDKLVSDLFDISKIEVGELRLEFVAVSLADVLEEVLRSLQRQIDNKEQTMSVTLPQDLPMVWADRNRLVQVLVNLVSNAHKYTPERGEIRIWAEQGETGMVHVTVADNGIGISTKDREKIFQKFFRSQDDRARDVPGTGLGLHITKTLVERQGGRIWFESELRQGATFHFTAPLAQQQS